MDHVLSPVLSFRRNAGRCSVFIEQLRCRRVQIKCHARFFSLFQQRIGNPKTVSVSACLMCFLLHGVNLRIIDGSFIFRVQRIIPRIIIRLNLVSVFRRNLGDPRRDFRTFVQHGLGQSAIMPFRSVNLIFLRELFARQRAVLCGFLFICTAKKPAAGHSRRTARIGLRFNHDNLCSRLRRFKRRRKTCSARADNHHIRLNFDCLFFFRGFFHHLVRVAASLNDSVYPRVQNGLRSQRRARHTVHVQRLPLKNFLRNRVKYIFADSRRFFIFSDLDVRDSRVAERNAYRYMPIFALSNSFIRSRRKALLRRCRAAD